MLTFNFHLQQS
jgi:hypothetical protein